MDGSDFPQYEASPRLIHDFLQKKIEGVLEQNELFTFLFIHLRGVRRINTMLGYHTGEKVVQITMDRLRDVLPGCDTVARISSDELVVVSMDCNSPSCAIKGSRAVIDALKQTVVIDEADCLSDPVVGISLYPNDGDTPTQLVRHASLAAERADADEDPFYAFFSADLGQNALKEFDLQQQVRRATSQRQFELHYQPKINAGTFAPEGCEALIRWRDPSFGLRQPGEFLGAAERGGLMVPIGFFVLQQACDQLRKWLDDGYENAAISINVAPRQFEMRNWVSVVANELARTNIPPSKLTLEVTEGCSIAGDDRTIAKLHELRKLGVHISIDDFGTGHSSLAYLSKLPIDEIKIDRTFVQSASENPVNAQICENVIELAHRLGAKATAEGVETVEQANWLKDLGCDLLQGFLFDRAAPSDQFERWLAPGATGHANLAPEA